LGDKIKNNELCGACQVCETGEMYGDVWKGNLKERYQLIDLEIQGEDNIKMDF
jgi:hypothetical protein